MLKHSLFVLMTAAGHLVLGQSLSYPEKVSKPAIDTNALKSWVSLKDAPLISGDGNYLAYGLIEPFGGHRRMVVRSVTGDWSRELPGVQMGIFSADSRQWIYQHGDTLYFQLLGGSTLSHVAGIRTWKEVGAGLGKWVGWQLTDSTGELVLHNLINGTERRFYGVADYSFAGNGESLVMRSEERTDTGVRSLLQWVKMPQGSPEFIWQGDPGMIVNTFGMDESGLQVTLGVSRGQSASLWYWKEGMKMARQVASDQSHGIDPGLSIDPASVYLSYDGRYMLFQLKEQDIQPAPAGAQQVDIWSYRDTLLQSTQLLQATEGRSFMASLQTEGSKERVIQLESVGKRPVCLPLKGDYLVQGYNPYKDDRYWLPGKDHYQLVSLRDGSRRELVADIQSEFWFSPGGRYLLYYRRGECYTYELQTGKERRVSAGVPPGQLSWYDNEDGGSSTPQFILPFGVAGWLQGDSGILVYDDYDIWQLDPSGKKAARNITGGYGRRHHIRFRLTEWLQQESTSYIGEEDNMLLTAFDTKNKYNGFCRVGTGGSADPHLLLMGPWTLNHQGGGWLMPANAQDYPGSLVPVKAREKDRWVVERSTASEAPNYYLTDDLKTLAPLTDLHPGQPYNWLTTELLHYPQVDGTPGEGVLYKPEDFDPKKKYPLIIHYYQQFSHRLYEYPEPALSNGEINVAWFVSRGYLVFTPDIRYQIGYPGQSVYNCVVGAAKYLSKLSYVDGKRMGINGHSWGGFETYYLVTHTHLFAAALAGSGGSGSGEWFSASLTINNNNGSSSQENREVHLGATPWDHPERYLSNSPVLHADHVTTPLLMLQCKADELTWPQGLEMFLALRRLGKRTWMLQYDHGSHVLLHRREQRDYTIRVDDFFDHYLKGQSPPRWMTEGIPARLKGIQLRYEPDNTGREP